MSLIGRLVHLRADAAPMIAAMATVRLCEMKTAI